ncbi:MAG: hypothetical protein IJ137_06660 [Eubacterium sp.]|nr:hypothetical protein [Eubacterium sp.]
MNHYLDIDDELFRAIQNHEISQISLEQDLFSSQVKVGDELKLYHPGDPAEALRVEVDKVEEDSGKRMLKLQITLTEWLFQIETDLDHQLQDENSWF